MISQLHSIIVEKTVLKKGKRKDERKGMKEQRNEGKKEGSKEERKNGNKKFCTLHRNEFLRFRGDKREIHDVFLHHRN
jgi:hypothetical protein